ncbi:ArfGAP with FG repeats 1 [Rhizopus stolonifer]|uniref:ArfGAP with FG repeats 1 n=1 Tax=Rhizopus stolonifer TaxID=4846 RepID=A0A367J575_RHIST|nr:ArfGAP with FG repeats 1 [Rhizopus stolonifer]
MAALLAKKEEEWNQQKLKELLRLPENKKCFDCPTKSPFFVNVSIQTFVCTRCSGLVREVGHRVKSISASKFSGPEIVALEYGGNQVARTIWLSTYNNNLPEPETDGDVRLFMRQKYYEQKWLDRQKGIDHAEKVKCIITDMFKEDGTRKQSKRQSLDTTRPKIVPTQSWVDDNIPIGLISTVKNNVNAMNDLLLNQDMMLSPKSPTFAQNKAPVKNDIFSELTALNQSTPTHSGSILQPNSPTQAYAGGILQPNSPTQAYAGGILQPNSPTQPKPTKNTSIDIDPYEALRDLSMGPSKKDPANNVFSDLDPLFNK